MHKEEEAGTKVLASIVLAPIALVNLIKLSKFQIVISDITSSGVYNITCK